MPSRTVPVLCAVLLLSATPVRADKPEWAGEKGKGHNKAKQKDDARHFRGEQRDYVRAYYEDEYRGGHCPPGLAKKHNGCMPPGQAKKWKMGKPLPSSVAVYELPPPLVVKIGPPPSGYKYVRVASDILLIAVGTSIVIDAINDLGRL